MISSWMSTYTTLFFFKQPERGSKTSRSSRKDSHRDDRRRPPERDERDRESERKRKDREIHDGDNHGIVQDKARLLILLYRLIWMFLQLFICSACC